MKKLARYLKENGLKVLGTAFEAYKTGGLSLIPKFVKKVTGSLGLPENASESDILATLMGNTDHLEKMRQLENESDKYEIDADLQAYLAELDFDKTRIIQQGETNRVDAHTNKPYVYKARPWGLYLTLRVFFGGCIFTAFIAMYSFYVQSRLLASCSPEELSACLDSINNYKLPIEIWIDMLKEIPDTVWWVMAAPSLSYYPLRSADKWINSRKTLK